MAQSIDTASGQPIQPVTIVGASNSSGNVSVDISQSDAIVPIDIQNHLQNTIQTHNAVSVGASLWSEYGSWIDTDGFDKVVISYITDNNTTQSAAQAIWSNDGTTKHITETITNTVGAYNQVGSSTAIDTKCRYFKIALKNPDTAATGAWTTGTNYAVNALVSNAGNVYKCTVAGAGTSTTAPTNTSGTVSEPDGYSWQYLNPTAHTMSAWAYLKA